MKNKYNLALMPLNADKSNEVVKCAKKFSALADKYLLGEKSLPHVTLYHFEAEEQNIENVWKDICRLWYEKPITLEFKEFNFSTSNNENYWISLLPNHCDVLHKMHRQIAQLIKMPIKKTFDPHMTLIRTLKNECKNEIDSVSKKYDPIADTFILSLGLSDDVGQLTEIIYQVGRADLK